MCIALFFYLVVPFLYDQDWGKIAYSTFVPHIELNKEYLAVLVGILGTTISPYLFLWQTSVEVEELKQKKKRIYINRRLLSDMRQDVDFGMAFSGLVMFFIILTTGTVLHQEGITQIDTVDQAAKALQPLAGDAAYLLFALGVIGTGLIAIPVLCGSVSYLITESFDLPEGLDKKFHEAKAFYTVIAVSLIIGLSLNYIGISPVKALIYSAILYGLTAPVMIAIILHISNNKKVMGKHTNSRLANVLGFIALILMTTSAVALIYFQYA
jgi:Mn2+/Fe2+ NRAMP family transporter